MTDPKKERLSKIVDDAADATRNNIPMSRFRDFSSQARQKLRKNEKKLINDV